MREQDQVWELSYNDDFDEFTGNIIKTNAQFVKYIAEAGSIVIEGNSEDLFLFNFNNNSYKMRGIFLPTTMLVVPELVISQQTEVDPLKSSKHVASVCLQTTNYLKIEPYQVEYNLIYSQIMKDALQNDDFRNTNNFGMLVEYSGSKVSQIMSILKITQFQLTQIAKYAPFVIFHQHQFMEVSETTLIALNFSTLIELMRQLIPFLTENQMIGSWFTFDQTKNATKIHHEKMLMLLAKVFELEVNFSLEKSYQIGQPMEIEGQQIQRMYKISLQSIVHFILQEHALVKTQYSSAELDKTAWSLLQTYLPVGYPEFQQERAKEKLQELMGFYFLTIAKMTESKRVYYNPLLIDSTIKGRIQFMNGYKKKFSLSQIKGIMRYLIGINLSLNDILLKNFRKCGNQYEIKLIIPK